MNRCIYLVALFLCCALPGRAAENYTLQWQKGNRFYEEKEYDSAVFYLEQIAAIQPNNADLYYNLGNSYYRLNQVASAILNYQRALLIDPGFTLAKDNLLLAQSRIGSPIPQADDIFFIRWWRSGTRPGRADALAIGALSLFVVFILIVLYNRIRKAGRMRLPPQVSVFVFLAFLCLLSLAAVSANNATAHTRAVVMQADAPLMNVQIKGKPLALVPEGTTINIKSEKGDWAEVSLPDGRSGWLQRTTFHKI